MRGLFQHRSYPVIQRLLAASALATLAMLALPRAGHAEGTVTGNQLMQACSSGKVPDDRQCIGYIAGAVDQVSANPSLKGVLCPLPQGTALKDVKATVLKYGKAHPDKVGQGAVDLLNDAIKDRYPCKS
jgi:hypothetical protein